MAAGGAFIYCTERKMFMLKSLCVYVVFQSALKSHFLIVTRSPLVLLSNSTFSPFIKFFLPRCRQSRTWPSCPGRTPRFTPKCSQRSVCLRRSRPALPPPVSSLSRSLTFGSNTLTRPLGGATMSTASPRRGPGSLLDGPADGPPPR